MRLAATRLITMHEAKGKALLKSLSDRIDYSQNPSKTRDGDLITINGIIFNQLLKPLK